MIAQHIFLASATLASMFLICNQAGAITVNLGAVKDNTLYEHPSGSLSNGAGPNFFAGVTGGFGPGITRGLIMFDIAAEVPAAATVTSATLTLNVSRVANSLPDIIEIRRVSTDWGEGDSIAADGGGGGGLATAGDATWLHSFSPATNWTNVGGDYSSTVSATKSVGSSGSYSWSSAQLATDVQEMIFDPHLNFGWALLGNESFPQTAKRFDSRENPTAANRPLLTIEYDLPGGGSPTDFDGDGDTDGDDLTSWSNAYGSGSGGDADGDGDSDGSDYLAWQIGFTGPAGVQAIAVPEPTAATILLSILTMGTLGRRRHAQ